jgi:hypothetical protein
MILLLGFTTYIIAVTLGIVAWRRQVHFGRWHHIAYGAACLGTGAAIVFSFHIALAIPAACLAVMPRLPGRSIHHKVAGLVGLIGWAGAGL